MLVFVGMSALQKQGLPSSKTRVLTFNTFLGSVYKGVLDKNLLELLGEQKKQGKVRAGVWAGFR
eukprot:1273411-Amorphochlora_amoeboformis.AAC.1